MEFAMKQFVMISLGAALFAFATAGCASDPGSAGGPKDPRRGGGSETQDQSKADRATDSRNDSRIVEGPGGATMIIHGEDDWVHERIQVSGPNQTAK